MSNLKRPAVIDDISSAEEESIRRKRLKEKAQKSRAAARALEKPKDYEENKKTEEGKVVIHLQPLSAFAHEHKYLTFDDPHRATAACERSAAYFNSNAVSGASGSAFEALVESLIPSNSSSASSSDVCGTLISDTVRRCREAHTEACRVNPSEQMILHTLLPRCFLPMYHSSKESEFVVGSVSSSDDYDKAVSAKLESDLNRRIVVLPHFSADFEQSQLKEAGEWTCAETGKKLKYPACVNGTKVGFLCTLGCEPRVFFVLTVLVCFCF